MIPVQSDFSANVQAAYRPPGHVRHRVIGPLECDCCNVGDRDVHAVPRVLRVECLPSYTLPEGTDHGGHRHPLSKLQAELIQHLGSLLFQAISCEVWVDACACRILILQ